jgi:hypothetical protein
MNTFNLFRFRVNTATRTLAVIMSVKCLLAADANSVTIDWSARTTGQQACIAAGTSGSTAATLVITNANIIIYEYSLNVKSYQLASNDAPAFLGAQASAQDASFCDIYEAKLSETWKDESIFPTGGRSVPLADTRSALRNHPLTALIQNKSTCGGGIKDAKLIAMLDKIVGALQLYQAKAVALDVNANLSTISFPYQIDNTHYYVFTLTERSRFDNKLTNATLHWKCGLDDTLTLSVGVMGTTLPYRTYTSQSVPSGTSTQNVLAVSGASGWTPQGLALLNYKLFNIDKGPLVGMAVSTGPVFKFGGTPQVSNFGWFAGVSVSLWRRLFVTPGMHLGQFADFPLGFAPGSVIPANFGTLTPVTRWSGRFGIGITFQTNSFAKATSNTPTNTTPPTGK